MVSDDAMADETTPPVNVATRTPVRVGTAMTVVAIVTTVIEAIAVKAEAKAAFEQRAAVMVVAMVVALASVPHGAAAVAARVGRTRVVGSSKVLVGIRMGAPIRVSVQIKPRALMRLAGLIKVPDARIRAADSSPAVVEIRADEPIKVAVLNKAVAASKADALIKVAGSSKGVVAIKMDAPTKVAASTKAVAASAIAAAAANSRLGPIKATSIRAHGVISLPGLTKASFATTLATALRRERLDRTPMETGKAVIARIAAAAAVVDEDADEADAVVAAEAKAAIARGGRRADRPWTPA
jgi:hypothetical protein